MDALTNMLREKIEYYNDANPTQKIAWELKEDKLKELIKRKDIPDKFIKKKEHQTNKYLSRDDIKHLLPILFSVLNIGQAAGISISTSPSRRFSRTPSYSPGHTERNLRINRTRNIENARAIASNRQRARTANAIARIRR